MPMANQDRITVTRRTPLTRFATGRLPSTAVRASDERPSAGADPSRRSDGRRTPTRSGVDRTKVEREPARTMHLAWFTRTSDRNVCARRPHCQVELSVTVVGHTFSGALPDPEALQVLLSTTVPVAVPPAIPSKVTPYRDQRASVSKRVR